MRYYIVCTISLAVAIATGCASTTVEPTLTGLARGEVYIQRIHETDESDIYRITYSVKVPPERAWEVTGGMPMWALGASNVRHVEVLSELAETDGGSRNVTEVKLTWRDGKNQILEIERDPQRRLIDMTVRPETRALGHLGHCTIKIDDFMNNETLVTAEIRIDNNFGKRLADLVLLLGLVERGARESNLREFWRTLATSHRQACASGELPPPSGRTHVVAIGIESFEADAWEPLMFAEADARDFYAWATMANPVPAGDEGTLIRELLVAPNNTRARLGEVLERMKPGGVVNEGDTILFFFAGHIGLEEDFLESQGASGAKFAYLITPDAEDGNLRWSAVKRGDVLHSLQLSAASSCVFFCDACYSGGQRVRSDHRPYVHLRGDRVDDDPGFRRLAEEKTEPVAGLQVKTAILAAAHALTRAAEDEQLMHGVFTYVVLMGLQGAADADEDSYVSLIELSDYIHAQVAEQTQSQQLPFVSTIPSGSRLAKLKWPVLSTHQ